MPRDPHPDLAKMDPKKLLQSYRSHSLSQSEWVRRRGYRTWLRREALPDEPWLYKFLHRPDRYNERFFEQQGCHMHPRWIYLYPFDFKRADGRPAIVYRAFSEHEEPGFNLFEQHPPQRWDEDGLSLNIFCDYARNLPRVAVDAYNDFWSWVCFHNEREEPMHRIDRLEII